MYHADLLGGIAARMAGIKNIIWGIRTTDVNAAGFSFTVFVRKVCSWLSSSVPRVIVCAAEASRKSHIAVGYDEGRMLVIPNGFDITLFTPMPRQGADFRHLCGFDDNSVIVGYVGRFHPVKDQANFVCAAGLSVASYPNVYFMMVGRDLVASNAELKSWIIKTGHADHFVLLGERSDMPLCLAAMDVFCLTSRTEGFPNVVGEAMAMSLPCVVTDVGDAAILVADTGVIVPAEDSVAFAKGLDKLLAMSPAEREKLGQSAKARIHSGFSIDKTREQFEELYEEMVRKAG
jgi:glycosyltransferase involved in cell wall biosynthesis